MSLISRFLHKGTSTVWGNIFFDALSEKSRMTLSIFDARHMPAHFFDVHPLGE